mmetsp:Transcript_29030/g.81215  ORF Transcript_29030/g.81215 Transcript_29030/m.81215 type:complete len:462 (-) Transcript_29030:44-1429(-)
MAKLRILMVSDFFLPNMGGIEMHIYQLSQCLLLRGHKVVVVTHAYGERKGVRYMTNGLKVYYLPQVPIYNNNSLPSVFPTIAILRTILIRERIDVIHGHQAFSSLAQESIVTGMTLHYPTVFTDHSLFGFRDAASIHTNKLLKMVLMDATHVICVSNTSKENTYLRASLDERRISVIPNAVDATAFCPRAAPMGKSPGDPVVIVIISRLTYRKGADLMIAVIPAICKRFANVRFLVGGDGPKFSELEQMREEHHLVERVTLLGSVEHDNVRDVLVQGDIFLNCSLTEAFCIAIVEAACCGLRVVATDVGGVHEALPRDMVHLAAPRPSKLIAALEQAISEVHASPHDPWVFHNRVKEMYSWFDIAARTEKVYHRVLTVRPPERIERFNRFFTIGSWAGILWMCCVVVGYFYILFLEWMIPRDSIEVFPDFVFAEKVPPVLSGTSKVTPVRELPCGENSAQA